MVHDQASVVFMSVFYILSTARSGYSYRDMVHRVVEATDQQIDPAEEVRDVGPGLMNTLQTQFLNVIVIGYLFHMKQALRRGQCAIPEEESHIAITLTAIEHEQVKRDINYFERVYLELYTIDEWNVHGFNNELIVRTNNPIQRFNRELNTRFATSHSSMATFATASKTLFRAYVQRVADVPRGREPRVQSERIVLPKPITIHEDIVRDAEDQATASFASNTSEVTSVLL
ncbi:hypothetical protein PHMEG_0006672 [Phytophthora megakarya]|uniref:Uncharacterized protein n=1 Tax=Phytophthora megakarya TaxID=4795 RepID=A0A225WQG2_9STRA|nr:hypothetical protein PHMEG_0006672 [Phytophthora megakarya]